MQNNITPIIVEKEGVSDATYKIIEFYAQNGSLVKEGELILCFETSKTAIDIESPVSGYIFLNAKQDEEVTIGETIAVIAEDPNFLYNDWFMSLNKSKTSKKDTQNSVIKISKPAQRLIDQYNIDISIFVNSVMITKEDVENHLTTLQETEELDTLKIDNNSILIFGGGGHAKMCIDLIKQTKTHTIIGIVDDQLATKTKVLGIPVLGNKSIIAILIEKGLQHAVLGVGGILTKGLRKKIFISLKKSNLNLPNIIHPSASVEPSVVLGEGNQIMQGVIIGSNVKIGNNCLINSGTIISHDTIIGDNVHIAPGAIIGGGVMIKDDTLIGMGCTIFLGLTIGSDVVIQNGIHVFKDIKDNCHIKKA